MDKISFNDLPQAVQEINLRLGRVEDLLREKQNPPLPQSIKIFTLSEAASFCRLPIPTFRVHLTRRNVSGSKPGKRWIFTLDDLEEFLNKFHHKTQDEIRSDVDQTVRSIKRRISHVYILIEKYTTFPLKSIPLIVFNKLLWIDKSNIIKDDKNGYKTRDFQTIFSGER